MKKNTKGEKQEQIKMAKVAKILSEMEEYKIKRVEISQKMGIHSSNITLFLSGQKGFSADNQKRYFDAFDSVINDRKKRSAAIEVALSKPNKIIKTIITETTVKKRYKPQAREPLKIKEILPVITRLKSELDRYCIYQVEVCRKTGIDTGRISRFFNGKAYTTQARNQKVIDACEELITQKKQRRGEIPCKGE